MEESLFMTDLELTWKLFKAKHRIKDLRDISYFMIKDDKNYFVETKNTCIFLNQSFLSTQLGLYEMDSKIFTSFDKIRHPFAKKKKGLRVIKKKLETSVILISSYWNEKNAFNIFRNYLNEGIRREYDFEMNPKDAKFFFNGVFNHYKREFRKNFKYINSLE